MISINYPLKSPPSHPIENLVLLGHVHESGAVPLDHPVRLVDVAEDVQFWLYLLHSRHQRLRAHADFFAGFVENAVGRTVRDQKVDVIWNIAPNKAVSLRRVLKCSFGIVLRVRRAKDVDSFDLHQVVLKVSAAFCEFCDDVLASQLREWIATLQVYLSRSLLLRLGSMD